MKIQSKSARVWIVLGLLGLILFAVREAVPGFGGVLGEMLSDAGIILLLVGWYVESRHQKKQHTGDKMKG